MTASPASVDLSSVEADLLACEQFLDSRRPTERPPRRLQRQRNTFPPVQPAFRDSFTAALHAAGAGARRYSAADHASQQSSDRAVPCSGDAAGICTAEGPCLPPEGIGVSEPTEASAGEPTIPLLAHIALSTPSSRGTQIATAVSQPAPPSAAGELPYQQPERLRIGQLGGVRAPARPLAALGDSSSSLDGGGSSSSSSTHHAARARLRNSSSSSDWGAQAVHASLLSAETQARSAAADCAAAGSHAALPPPLQAASPDQARQQQAVSAAARSSVPGAAAPCPAHCPPTRDAAPPAPLSRWQEQGAAWLPLRASSDSRLADQTQSADATPPPPPPAAAAAAAGENGSPSTMASSRGITPEERQDVMRQLLAGRRLAKRRRRQDTAPGTEAGSREPATQSAALGSASVAEAVAAPPLGASATSSSPVTAYAAAAGGGSSGADLAAATAGGSGIADAAIPVCGCDTADSGGLAAAEVDLQQSASADGRRFTAELASQPSAEQVAVSEPATPPRPAPPLDAAEWVADEGRLAALAAALAQRRPGDPPGAFEIDTALLYSPQSSAVSLSVAGTDSEGEGEGGTAASSVKNCNAPLAATRAGTATVAGLASSSKVGSVAEHGAECPSELEAPEPAVSPLAAARAVPSLPVPAGLHDSVHSMAGGFGGGSGGGRDVERQRQLLDKLARLKTRSRPASPLATPSAAAAPSPATNLAPAVVCPAASAAAAAASARPRRSSTGSVRAPAPTPLQPRSADRLHGKAATAAVVFAGVSGGGRSGSCSGGNPGGSRLARLAAPPVERWAKCEALRQQAEADAMRGCSFRPKTVKHAGERVAPAGTAPAGERLYSTAATTAAHIERLRADVAAAELAGCTFAPKLETAGRMKSRASVEPQKPLHQRLGDVTKRRQEKRLAAREAEARRQAALTAPPVINPKSAELAAAAATRPPEQRPRPRPKSGASGTTECTFQPVINSNTGRLLEDTTNSPLLRGGFTERQAAWEAGRKAKREAAAALQEAHAGTFSPDTGNAAQVLARSAAVERLWESPAERVQRLAVKDAAEVRQAREGAREEYYSQFSHHPAINPRSRQLAQAHDLEALVADPKRRQTLAAAHAVAEAAFQRSCPFQPDTSASREVPRECGDESGAVVPFAPRAAADRLAAHAAERRAKLLAAKAEKEAAELAACTFRPAVTPLPLALTSQGAGVGGPPPPVVVHGLNAFLERKDAARRKAEEQAELEAKVFHTRPRLPAQHTTTPRPFSLSEAEAQERSRARQAQLAGRAAAEREKACPFRPNAAAELEAIEALLAQDDSWLSD